MERKSNQFRRDSPEPIIVEVAGPEAAHNAFESDGIFA